jgi:hypothetical protein
MSAISSGMALLQLIPSMGDPGHSANRLDAAEFDGWALDVGA